MFRRPPDMEDRPLAEQQIEIVGLPPRVMILLVILASISLIVEFGFGVGRWVGLALAVIDLTVAGCFVADLALSLRRAKSWLLLLRSRWYEYALVLLYAAALLLLAVMLWRGDLVRILNVTSVHSPLQPFLAVTRLFVLTSIVVRLLRSQARLLAMGLRPEYILVASFGILVLIGWALLLLPRATAVGYDTIGFVDALFTSISAVCVTGLAVRDIGTAFSPFGQTTILLLLQIGGMGIITFVALVSLLSGKALSVPQMVTLRDVVKVQTVSEVKRYILGIVLITVVIELTGALLLYISLPRDHGTGMQRLFWSLFHSISAFCNAGISLQEESLSGLVGNWGVNLSIMALIVVGGLGFPVILDLLKARMSWVPAWRRRRFLRHRQQPRMRARHLSLQTRISLVVTLVLIVLGTLFFWILEAGNTLGNFDGGGQFLASLFQAITTRSAGFNTLPISELRPSSQIGLLALMMIGAGPVSTGGGIKTVAFGVLLLTLRSFLTGRDQVEVFGRTLPRRVVHAAIGVFIIYIVAAVFVLFGLTLTDPHLHLGDLLFESISALSTVGLTTGITPELSTGGKLLLCFAMFLGRVGPLTLAMSVFRSSRGSQAYQYPEEDIVVS